MFNLKNGWSLIKTNKVRPFGYKGYTFILYDKDDVTIFREVNAKTAKNMAEKIKALETLAGMFKMTKRLKKRLKQ